MSQLELQEWQLTPISGEVGPQLCSVEKYHNMAMSNSEQHTLHSHHKEESERRIKVDKANHLSLCNTFDVCINPLDAD